MKSIYFFISIMAIQIGFNLCNSQHDPESSVHVIKNKVSNSSFKHRKSFLVSQLKTENQDFYISIKNSFTNNIYDFLFVENYNHKKIRISNIGIENGILIGKIPESFFSGIVYIINSDSKKIEYKFKLVKGFNPIPQQTNLVNK